jgi:hypothetical protein
MKRLIIPVMVLIIVYSCRVKSTMEAGPGAELDLSTLFLPFKLSYPGKIVFGDPGNVVTDMNFNKRFIEGDTDLGEYLADRVSLYFPDGSSVSATRDSILSLIKVFRKSLSEVEMHYISIFPIKNLDQNQEWILSWFQETDTYLNDSVDSYFIHEDIYFQNGKIRSVYQYSRKPNPAGM